MTLPMKIVLSNDCPSERMYWFPVSWKSVVHPLKYGIWTAKAFLIGKN